MLFSDVWSETAALLNRLMKIHSNPPILYMYYDLNIANVNEIKCIFTCSFLAMSLIGLNVKHLSTLPVCIWEGRQVHMVANHRSAQSVV